MWTVSKYLGVPIISFVIGVLADDLVKPLIQRHVEDRFFRMLPLESPLVQAIWPNSIRFESSDYSGCSGGELNSLVDDAKGQGMTFRKEDIVRQASLCVPWQKVSNASSILTSMSDRFPNCFATSENNTEFEVLTSDPHVCRTDYIVDQQTNEWTRKQGHSSILCLSAPTIGPISSEEPYIRDCDNGQLKTVGIAE